MLAGTLIGSGAGAKGWQSFDNRYTPFANYPANSTTLLTDISGNGKTLTQTGSTRVTPLVAGLSVLGYDGASYLERAVDDASFRVTGALSALTLFNRASLPAGGSSCILNYSGVGELEDANILYQLFVTGVPGAAGPLVSTAYFHEHGAGVNDTFGWNSGALPGGWNMIGFTRSAPAAGMQTVKIFLNGGIGAQATITACSGGTNVANRFRIGNSLNDPTQFFIGGIGSTALYATELTEAQVAERWNWVLGGRTVPRF